MAKSSKFAGCANLIPGPQLYSRHRWKDAAAKALAKARKSGASFCIVPLVK